MELRQLRYAVAVADRRSFTKAAASEIVVQSALSQQIRKLEQELDVRLFERTTRSVSITAAGELLLPIIRQVLTDVEQVTVEAQRIRGVIRGRITLGLMEVPPEELEIGSVIETFHEHYPGIDISVRSAGGEQLVRAVREREIDVALVGVTGLESGDGLESLPILSEELVAVVPLDHELAGRASVGPEELAAYPFIDFPRGYGLRTETDRGFASTDRRVAFEVTRVVLVTEFVRHGLGVAVLPESVARAQASSGDLALMTIRDAGLRRPVSLVYPPAPALSAVGRAFVETVEQLLRSTEPDSW